MRLELGAAGSFRDRWRDWSRCTAHDLRFEDISTTGKAAPSACEKNRRPEKRVEHAETYRRMWLSFAEQLWCQQTQHGARDATRRAKKPNDQRSRFPKQEHRRLGRRGNDVASKRSLDASLRWSSGKEFPTLRRRVLFSVPRTDRQA